MKKRFIYIAGGLLVLAGLAVLIHLHNGQSDDPDYVPPEFRHGVTDTDISHAAAKLNRLAPPTPMATAPAPLNPNQPVRLAIGSLGLADDEQNRGLSDLVLAELSGAPGLNLVERQSLDAVLRELSLNLSGLVRAKDAVRAGKLLKADWFLLGTQAKINGTNSIVVRVVDARTGILRDAGVFSGDESPTKVAAAIAAFVRQSRQNAATAKPRVYLAIGAFEDLSVNNRQANFPTQLRGYLLSAFQSANVTLLEREYVDTLLQEVHLDLAGLTEESSGSVQPMQSAYWLVTGRYQSYENNGFEVEVLLNVAHIFGLHPKEVMLRGPPSEPLFRQIQQTIEAQINQKAIVLVPNRRTEAINQLELGKDLFNQHGLAAQTAFMSFDMLNGLPIVEGRDRSVRGEEAIRRKQNIQEAIRAFQTVLILDPTNREARLCLAACLQNPVINHRDEARACYQQVLEEPAEDKWVAVAQRHLGDSFYGEGAWGEQPWYAKAAAQSANPRAKAYFQQEADRAARYLKFLQDRNVGNASQDTSNAIALEQAKTNLLKEIQSYKDGTGHLGLASAMQVFARTFGTNESAAARALIDLLPEVQAKFPGLRPHLQGAVVSLQVDTNAPIIAEFQKTLDWCNEHSDQVNKSEDFWGDMHHVILPWCYEHACFEMAAIIIGHEQKARAANANYSDDERLVLALEYFEHEQWLNALRIFQCYSNRPVVIRILEGPIRGHWVDRSGTILTGKYAAFCEQKLGLTHVGDPREFDLGKPCLDLDDASAFAVDSTGLWIASHAEIRHLDFNLKTNLRISLPMDGKVPFTCIWVGESNAWAGTAGAGLVEVDKASQHYRRFTVTDGLLMDSVSQLHLTGDNLWIGYGQGSSGGLGKLDLSSRHFRSFMPALGTNGYAPELVVDPLDGPPRHPVVDLASMMNGDVLALVSGKGLQRFSAATNSWATLPNQNGFAINSIAVDGRYLVEGVGIHQLQVEIESKIKRGQTNIPMEKTVFAVSQEQLAQATSKARANSNLMVRTSYGVLGDKGGLEIGTLQDGRWQILTDADGLPNPPRTMAWDNGNLWVGGEAFMALVDLKQGKVRNFCYIQGGSVRHIQIGGGYVWAQFDRHLHRASLAELR